MNHNLLLSSLREGLKEVDPLENLIYSNGMVRYIYSNKAVISTHIENACNMHCSFQAI